MTTAVVRKLSLLALLSAGALGTPAAHAQQCNAPPGTAAVEQYCETVPEATGNRSTRKNSGATKGETRENAPAPVAAPTLDEIERSGPQGEQLGRVLRGGENAPAREAGAEDRPAKTKAKTRERADRTDDPKCVDGVRGRDDSAGGASGRDAAPGRRGTPCVAVQHAPLETPASLQSGNALSAVGAAVSGGDTVGGVFPLVLLSIAGLVGGAGWIRRSRGGR
jgi:hypothetical protein